MNAASSPTLATTEYRLARHYLNRLRTAAAAVTLGQASIPYGQQLFDQEWEQIKHWQNLAAQRCSLSREWKRLCIDFPLAGLEILTTRSSLGDQARWLEAGLNAAAHQDDGYAELSIHYALSTVYFRLGFLEKAETASRQLLNQARQENNLLYIGRGTFSLGKIADERGAYPAALDHYQRALNVFREIKARTDEGIALHGLGAVSLWIGDFSQALEFFQQHHNLVQDGKNPGELISALLSVAQALIMLEDYPEAEIHLRRAVQLSRTYGDKRLLAAGLIMLGQLAGEQGQEELEQSYYTEGIEAAREVGSQRDVIHGLSNAGLSHMLTGDYQSALACLEEGLILAREVGIPRFICNLQRNLADTYLGLNNLEKAWSAALESLTIARDLGSTHQTVKALTSAVGYWQKTGQSEQAARWAGFLAARPETDHFVFDPICKLLEAALGPEAYRQALDEGNRLDLDQIVLDVLSNLRHSD